MVHQYCLNLAIIEEKIGAHNGHRGHCFEKRSLQHLVKELLVEIADENVIERSVALDFQGMSIECYFVLERYRKKNQKIHPVHGDNGDHYIFANVLAYGGHKNIACSMDLIRFEKRAYFAFVRSGNVKLDDSLNCCSS